MARKPGTLILTRKPAVHRLKFTVVVAGDMPNLDASIRALLMRALDHEPDEHITAAKIKALGVIGWEMKHLTEREAEKIFADGALAEIAEFEGFKLLDFEPAETPTGTEGK